MATGITAVQTIDVVTPAAGESVTEGTILEWHVKVGDYIKVDDTIVEISTDKVDVELPSPGSGTVSEILVEEGETVTVGQVIARISVNGAVPAQAPAPDAPVQEPEAEQPAAPAEVTPEAPSPQGESQPAGSSPSPSNGATGQTVDVVTPAAGESVTEGTILEWRVKVGDAIKVDDTIVEISTDKVDLELPAPATGTVSEILVQEGDTVTVGQLIARISLNGAIAAPAAPSAPPAATTGQADGASASAATSTSTPAAGVPEGTKASPVAARAAAVEGVDLAQVSGSGPAGRITKSDVLSAAAGGGANTANGAGANGHATTATEPSAQPMRGGAAMLVRYMEESRSIPTATSFRTLTVTRLDARRRELKAGPRKVSFTHLIAYAIVCAAQDMPVMANHFAEIDGKPQRMLDGRVNLGLAVDVEKKDGSRTLMVPVITDAGSLAFDAFLNAYDALVEKARTNTLTADDLVGANVTLTNPGGLGTVASVPRLMPGQGTIVATGSIAYPVGLGNIGEMIGAEKVMTMTSTYDHRVIQGAESGRFLARIEAYLQGEDGFYEDVFGSLGVDLGPAPALPAPAAAAAASASTSTSTSTPGAYTGGEEMLQAVHAASTFVSRVRSHGHLAARLDPLGTEPEGDPGLDPEALGLTPEIQARLPARIFQMYVPGATLADALPHLRETYCGTIAYEIEHIASHRQRVWLREHIEAGAFRHELTNDERRRLLRRLVKVDALERFMHKAYLGQHQFSIEGLDMTVPMLDELIQLSAAHGGQEVVVGMAHRGRLNVLAHNLGRTYDTIFAEFEGASTLEAVTTIPQGGTGDVKYHHGTQGTYALPDGGTIRVNLESNPSHLEYVSPVVEGATRAAQTTRKGPHAHQDTNAAVPIVIHGDASFPGQGVVSETFNLQALDGYKVGGTVHLIMNNQVGFTTDPDDARSTRWASDLAKGFDVPIIHVNADDVPACISAVRLAFAFRQEFGHDVLIDLIGYRRFGHNESDEPAYTQPEMYAKIKTKKRVSEIWAERLETEGIVSKEEVEQQAQEVWDNLTLLHQRLKAKIAAAAEHEGEHTTGEYQLDRSPSPEVETAVPAAELRALGEQLLRVPDGFTVHPKMVKQLERRHEALAESAPPGIDWAHAEALAFASLLTEGTPLRLTGQDTERGTFSQRHMVLHDAKTGQTVCPIQSLPDALAPLELHNSPLSELACMGFEYGYSQEAPETLVLWEAQFGDFVNSAQVIIDQFITSGLAKWGQTSRLTLLLPHGYEGSGPEHSSARLERFLRAAAEGNIRVASPTTPAQYFHLLRRQARVAKQRPLVVMTPKSLLRLAQAASSIEDMAEGTGFQPVLAEPGVQDSEVTRLVLCTGKIYYDLVGHPERAEHTGLAVARVELLYPFPERQILELMGRYPNLREVLWVQEEPRNMGARAHMFPRLMQIMPEGMHFGYIGRPERASPGEGYPAAHIDEQNRIVTTAIDLRQPISQYPRKTPGER